MLLALMLPLQAQINNTLYFMQGVPQANKYNPAYQPNASFYLGFPVLSPTRAGVRVSLRA